MKNILHLKAPGGWINDPNGFIFYKGKYHLFYQHYPKDVKWGLMHWGHAVSDDLIHWEHGKIALYPSQKYDRKGVFSGSAIEEDGKMVIYYTGVYSVADDTENLDDLKREDVRQCQMRIESADGISFDNEKGKDLVIPAFEGSDICDAHDFRDPKVWKENGHYYMAAAGTYRGEEGVLLIFESTDGFKWNILSRVQDERFGYTLECPDLFKADGEWLLICSPMGIVHEKNAYENQAVIQKVSFDSRSGQLKLTEDSRMLDYGGDLYAPQSSIDEDGRRIYIGWIRMPKALPVEKGEDTELKEWIGMMSLPRYVEIRDGKIFTPVHRNVREYFSREGRKEEGFGCCSLRLSEGEKTNISGVEISVRNGCVIADRHLRLKEDIQLPQISQSPYVGSECSLEIFTEPNLIEIFINDGQYVITNVLY